jgi:hypothetical protein
MWLALTLICFGGFLGSLFAFVWRGCNRDGSMRRSGPVFLAMAVVTLAGWVFALPRIPPPYPMSELKDFVWVGK